MTVFGLTGNIGSGKSTVGRLLQKAGFAYIDADYLGKTAAEPGTFANAEIKRVFGTEYFDENGNLLRKKMGTLVFANPHELAKLNSILHPAIKMMIKDGITESLQKNPQKHIMVEAAIMFESGMNDVVEKVILVAADEEIRLKRVMERDSLTEEQVRQRMKNQMEQSEKEKLSDYIIANNGDFAELELNVQCFLNSIKTD